MYPFEDLFPPYIKYSRILWYLRAWELLFCFMLLLNLLWKGFVLTTLSNNCGLINMVIQCFLSCWHGLKKHSEKIISRRWSKRQWRPMDRIISWNNVFTIVLMVAWQIAPSCWDHGLSMFNSEFFGTKCLHHNMNKLKKMIMLAIKWKTSYVPWTQLWILK